MSTEISRHLLSTYTFTTEEMLASPYKTPTHVISVFLKDFRLSVNDILSIVYADGKWHIFLKVNVPALSPSVSV